MDAFLSKIPVRTMVNLVYTFGGFVAYFDILSVFMQTLLNT